MNDWTRNLAPEDSAASLEDEINRLAKLEPVDYDRSRKEAAERLGIRTATLDEAVARRRPKPEAEADADPFADIEPWSETVDGARLLDELTETFLRFSVLPDHAEVVLTLWVVFAHAHDAFMVSPLLALESPEKRCGKTTTLTVLQQLVPRPMPAVNVTPSVLFRVVEKYSPTVLVDEGDTFLRENDELRGILNGGHNRLSAFVWRSVGDDHEPRRFTVWAPKAIALIGELPDTLQDRAIAVPLRRKTVGETVERIRADRLAWATPLCGMAARWAADNMNVLRSADPDVPTQLNDRAADNWRPLFSIADAVGGDWPLRARAAALNLSAEAGDDDSTGTALLRDCRRVLVPNRESITPKDLADELAMLEESRWAEYSHGKPISARSVGRLLRAFGIVSRRQHSGRYFTRIDFADAWSRYLAEAPPEANVTNDTALKTKGNSHFQTTRTEPSRVVCEAENLNEINAVSFVTQETLDEF